MGEVVNTSRSGVGHARGSLYCSVLPYLSHLLIMVPSRLGHFPLKLSHPLLMVPLRLGSIPLNLGYPLLNLSDLWVVFPLNLSCPLLILLLNLIPILVKGIFKALHS